MAIEPELTPHRLTRSLQQSGVLKDDAVTDVQFEQIGAELGFNGCLYRLSLRYDRREAKAPASLVAKVARDKDVADKLRSESRFYEEFGGRVGIRMPRAYATEPDLLLLEDLSASKCGDVAAGCSPEEARLVLRHLGRFHATGWRNKPAAAHDWLPTWPIRPERFYPRFQEYHQRFLERFESELTDDMRKLTLHLIDRLPELVAELQTAPATVIHVDTHLDNVLFDGPDKIVLLDWPSAAIGPAVVDVVRFLATSLETPDLKLYAENLIYEYMGTLRDFGITEYSGTEFYRHLQLAGYRLWAGMATGYGACDPDVLLDRQRELQRVEIERLRGMFTACEWSRKP